MVFLTKVLRIKPNFLFDKPLSEMLYNTLDFRKLGLMIDDMVVEHSPEAREALRRLPEHIRDERNFRIVRAAIVSTSHSILPKEQWMTYEKDVRYLKPYITEVEKEMKEKEDWDKE